MNEKVLREVLQNLPERSTRDEQTVPWDSLSINDDPELLPAGCGLECVCAKGVVASISRRVGINAIASRRIVCVRCGGGRRPNASVLTVDWRPIENGTPRPRLNGGVIGERKEHSVMRRSSRRRPYRPNRTARGHAASCLLEVFVTGPDAMNHCLATRARRHGTAVVTVVRLCDESLIANVSG